MLDVKNATIVRKAINDYLSTPNGGSLEAVCRMEPIAQSTASSGYTVLGLQSGDVTLLVWVQFDETSGIIVRSVKSIPW